MTDYLQVAEFVEWFLHCGPAMFVVVSTTLLGVAVYMWLRTIPVIPGWVVKTVLPPVISGTAYMKFLSYCGPEHAAWWCPDPQKYLQDAGMAIAVLPGFILVPALAGIIRRLSGVKAGDTGIWNTKEWKKKADA